MKKEVIFVLLDDFADWEGAFLASALRTGVMPGQPGSHEVKYLTPGAAEVRSLGGMRVTPHYDASVLPEGCAGLILVGGMGWKTEAAEQIVPLVQQALSRGIPVGGICNATLFLGAHGFLNDVKHTSNTLALLQEWSGTSYTNEANYVEAEAVRDGNIVTANGSGYLEFTRECLLLLEADTPARIELYYRFNKKGLCSFVQSGTESGNE